MFVSDLIPPELRRVIEFLNERMSPTEVIGVEIKQYIGQGNLTTFVPRVVGQTEQAGPEDRRRSAPECRGRLGRLRSTATAGSVCARPQPIRPAGEGD